LVRAGSEIFRGAGRMRFELLIVSAPLQSVGTLLRPDGVETCCPFNSARRYGW
jgi:hypothetical protein